MKTNRCERVNKSTSRSPRHEKHFQLVDRWRHATAQLQLFNSAIPAVQTRLCNKDVLLTPRTSMLYANKGQRPSQPFQGWPRSKHAEQQRNSDEVQSEVCVKGDCKRSRSPGKGQRELQVRSLIRQRSSSASSQSSPLSAASRHARKASSPPPPSKKPKLARARGISQQPVRPLVAEKARRRKRRQSYSISPEWPATKPKKSVPKQGSSKEANNSRPAKADANPTLNNDAPPLTQHQEPLPDPDPLLDFTALTGGNIIELA